MIHNKPVYRPNLNLEVWITVAVLWIMVGVSGWFVVDYLWQALIDWLQYGLAGFADTR